MRAVELTLLSSSFKKDSIGQEVSTPIEKTIPIIDIVDIYSNEFYEAYQLGLRPSIKFIISSLNYDNETELKYMNELYSVIRTASPNADEITLICEKKAGKINKHD